MTKSNRKILNFNIKKNPFRSQFFFNVPFVYKEITHIDFTY